LAPFPDRSKLLKVPLLASSDLHEKRNEKNKFPPLALGHTPAGPFRRNAVSPSSSPRNGPSHKALRQRYAGTRFEEQRQLHLPQKHKATVRSDFR
jgi:hypothetical protein